MHPHSRSINASRNGTLAQLVEQRTENPCVPGSIPGGTTNHKMITFKKVIGTLAQLVEQRTENPCVPGSIPGGTTLKPLFLVVFFILTM